MVKKSERPKLGKQDWIKAGSQVLAACGVEAVRIEPLAKRLKVTKGSFYWHFKNRQALLEAILQAWVEQQTEGIIEKIDALEADAIAKLRHLFELAVEDDGAVEVAIRAWATNDAGVARMLENVDRRRLNYTKDLFLALGFTPFEATVRARMVYYALVGEFTIGVRASRDERLAEIRLQHEILTNRSQQKSQRGDNVSQ
ncbi:MAG: TetR/AcrR family transcriptional regulator [Cyanobacteria bacterium J06634_5]